MCMRELSNFKQKIWVKSDLIIHFSTFDCNVISMEACLQHSFVLAGLAACQPLRINKALYESEPSMYTQSMVAIKYLSETSLDRTWLLWLWIDS